MKGLRKYLFVALLSARTNVVYFAEVFSRIVFLGIILYVFSCLWRLVFKESGAAQLGALTLQQMIWYLTITEAISLSAPRASANVDLDVRSGTLINYLQRPLSYPLYSLASNFGERIVRLFVNLAVGSFIAAVLIGLPHLTIWGTLSFLLCVPMALIADFLACFLIGLGAFWLEDTSGIYIIYSRLTMMLGGMFFPLSIFPDAWRRILEWLPFASILYGPAKMFVSPSGDELVIIIAHQLLGVVVLGISVHLMYSYASKRVFVNGG